MNRIVREHYPASRLPEDLRDGMDPSSTVTITVVEEERRPDKPRSIEEIFAARQPPFRTKEEIDRDVRSQRDEWDD